MAQPFELIAHVFNGRILADPRLPTTKSRGFHLYEGLAYHQRYAVFSQCPAVGFGGEAAGNCHGLARGGYRRTLRRHEDRFAFDLRSPVM